MTDNRKYEICPKVKTLLQIQAQAINYECNSAHWEHYVQFNEHRAWGRLPTSYEKADLPGRYFGANIAGRVTVLD